MPHWFGKKLWKGTMKYNKAYYCQMYFNQILPQIAEITTQSRFGYHGLSHTNQVALFGIDLAHSINQDALPVMLAAGLHDCARTNDAWCTEHGPRALLVGRDFLAKNYKNVNGVNGKNYRLAKIFLHKKEAGAESSRFFFNREK